MKAKCEICGEKLGKFNTVQLQDGCICGMCNRISQKSMLASVADVKQAWEENHRRFQTFKASMTITNIGSGFLFVDTEHQLCYITHGKKPKEEPVVFKFSEIEEYRLEQVGQRTITKTKGGLGRAVVGGALFGAAGAIVGASTAKTETKQVGGVPILQVDLNLNGLKTTLSMSNPPLKSSDFLDSAMSV